ncbi:MAG: carboxypeptidase regulatory-like domain-containing protein [Bryobacterales bacterium]|nr:carboxypeptidase regulatory-like domain-containing protein [Bryobacterales bacterium]
MRFVGSLCRTLAGFVLLVYALAAQDVRGKVQGLVTDTTEAAIVGAKVTLININTSVEASNLTSDTGQYIFLFVEPGSYRIKVEASGFEAFTQDNVTVLTRGDVTLNVRLSVGAVSQAVEVSATALAMEFNTSTMSQTVDGRMLKDLPVLARNPFTLALLNPAVTNGYWDISHRNPFFSQSSNGVDIGNTLGRNDVLIDGVTIVMGSRVGYVPPMDAVQEVAIQQNAVDAEFGQSAGGVLALSMKAGTNELHGTGYYFGRNPKLNAVSNSVTHSPNTSRYHIGGGNAGFPIIKNKLFAFGSYEQWLSKFPDSAIMTLPTDLERTGDFSKSLNAAGGLRAVYDPFTTRLENGVASRTPFAGNVIPQSRMDPTSLTFMKDVWKPNNPGDNITGVNNYKLTFPWWSDYKNWSGRVDYNISDKLKVFGRYSQFREWESNDNFVGTPAFTDRDGGLTATINTAIDAVYTLNPTTVIDMKWGITLFGIDYDSPWARLEGGIDGYNKFWPNNPWYKPYMKDMTKFFYPRVSVGSWYSGMTGLWLHKPRKTSYQPSIVKHAGRHALKAGVSWRHEWEYTALPDPMAFNFGADSTANTFQSPNTALSGDPWASFLVGAVRGYASYTPVLLSRDNQWAFYFQDDFKVNRNLTLNLGLRYEYETPLYEDQNRWSRYVDLNNPIPEMQSNPIKMPAEVAPYNVSYKYNGAWMFTDPNNRGVFRSPKNLILPRIGAAIRINDDTAIRVGYARYATPILAIVGPVWNIPQAGYSARTDVQAELQGVPQAMLSSPFPATNPIILPLGNSLGRYTNLGNSATFVHQNLKQPVNDRFNFSLQRAIPGGLRADITYFLNLGHNVQPPANGGGGFYSRDQNMVDPNLSYTYKAALDQKVANPFYQYLTPQLFPGQLRNQPQVALSQLLRPYPQYGTLNETFQPNFSERYQALQVKVERPFSRGVALTMAYNFNRERTDAYFNAPDQYANRLTMIPGANPRHRMSFGGSYDLPIGKGRAYLNNLHPVANAIIGGWVTSHIFMWNSGSFLRFGQMIANGDPVLSGHSRQKWFNTGVFSAPLPYTPRMNPYQYEGLTGPRYWNLDSTLSKSFNLNERLRLEFRLETYNLTNSFMPSNPSTDVLSSLFGRSTGQANTGREMQYTLRLHF